MRKLPLSEVADIRMTQVTVVDETGKKEVHENRSIMEALVASAYPYDKSVLRSAIQYKKWAKMMREKVVVGEKEASLAVGKHTLTVKM